MFWGQMGSLRSSSAQEQAAHCLFSSEEKQCSSFGRLGNLTRSWTKDEALNPQSPASKTQIKAQILPLSASRCSPALMLLQNHAGLGRNVGNPPFYRGNGGAGSPSGQDHGTAARAAAAAITGPAARCQAQCVVLTHRVPEQSLPASEQGKQNSQTK